MTDFQRLSLEQIERRLDDRDISLVLDISVHVGNLIVDEDEKTHQHQRQQAQAFERRSR